MDEKERKVSPQLDTNMELERENWVSNLILTPKYKIDESSNEILESRDFTKNF